LARADSSSTIEFPDVITVGPPLGEELMFLNCVNRGTAAGDDSNSPFGTLEGHVYVCPGGEG
jgi:hypothetical protein